MNKPVEYWVAMLVGVLWVFHRNNDKTIVARTFMAAISAGAAFSIAPEFSEWTGRSENMSVMILAAFGYFAFDLIAAIISDRELMKDYIRKMLGGKSD